MLSSEEMNNYGDKYGLSQENVKQDNEHNTFPSFSITLNTEACYNLFLYV